MATWTTNFQLADRILGATKPFVETPAPNGEPAQLVDGHLIALDQLKPKPGGLIGPRLAGE